MTMAKFCRFQMGPGVGIDKELQMPGDMASIETRLRRLKGREARTQSIATRFTRAEERMLLEVAASQGDTLREWARDVLVAAAQGRNQGSIRRFLSKFKHCACFSSTHWNRSCAATP